MPRILKTSLSIILMTKINWWECLDFVHVFLFFESLINLSFGIDFADEKNWRDF